MRTVFDDPMWLAETMERMSLSARWLSKAAIELRRLHDENERLKAEVCKQVAGSGVVFDREIVEIAKGGA